MKQVFGVLILILLCSCSNKDRIDGQNELPSGQLESFKKQFNKQNKVVNKRLKGRKLSILDSAILAGSNPGFEQSLIYLAKVSDCSSCTSKAIEVLNSFDSTLINRIAINIGYSDVGGYSNNFKHSFEDSHGVIQEKLGYFHTPALILYGQRGVISSYLIPTYEDSIGLSRYLNSIYEHL